MEPLVITRPQPIRVAALATLAIIIAWAAVSADLSDFGVVAYPAIIALQTVREWGWRLELNPRGLHEKQGVGPARNVEWKAVEAVIMPDSAWWRVNPVLKVDGAPNIQLTASEGVDEVIRTARQKRKEIIGTAESISLVRSLSPWLVLLGLACLLLGVELAGAG
jgi:hypothetical protein